ncbi:MAG: 6,7-dimethyl-8-ribityllumazine synthase [Planctomycetota bacterium]|nr:6,7-dimethyl-8-ribityllumazine synthase [Planctomycetota bacterium]
MIGSKKRFCIIASRFNDFVTRRLVEGALDALQRRGVKEDDIELMWVPGSFEIALIALEAAETKRFQAIMCLGTIIKGETPHFDFIAAEAAKGIAHVGLTTRVPAVFGIVTADTLEQAIQRAGAKEGNKGAQAAEAAIEMANLLEQLR